MNNTNDYSTLMELPQLYLEKLILTVYVMVSTFLFLFRLSEKKNLIWKIFPQFCVLMTFVPVTHFSVLIMITFQNFLFSSSLSLDAVIHRLVPVLISCYPILYIPPIPFSITMEFDMLKYIPVFIITVSFLRRLYHFKKSKKLISVNHVEYIGMVHIALFLLVYWFLTIPQILLSILTSHLNAYPYSTRLLGFQESCVLHYLFVYAIPLAESKSVVKLFNNINIHPSRF
ncbi:hypothetical protein CRE_19045 [Caenorhabditis remanei]|uniref:Uncharacterized protein n=1 Tax=Caenorhabditis remanei TaxID=31234 RepID=E3LLB9_CAERE|nr:hypothetical protein CRE_19045 [Caenorhabditis remanei]